MNPSDEPREQTSGARGWSRLVAAGSLPAESVEHSNLLSLHRDDIRFLQLPRAVPHGKSMMRPGMPNTVLRENAAALRLAREIVPGKAGSLMLMRRPYSSLTSAAIGSRLAPERARSREPARPP